MKTPKDYLQQPYARIVIPVDQDSYHAEILEFPGCYAQGETPADAYANLENVAESWIETCISEGQDIPTPSQSVTFSGNVSLRLPRSVHRRASMLAERDQTSLNTFLVSAISERVGAEDASQALLRRMAGNLVQATFTGFCLGVFASTLSNNDKTSRFQEAITVGNTISGTGSPFLLPAPRK
jgi:predicted RNase H-like HicB family nuclease